MKSTLHLGGTAVFRRGIHHSDIEQSLDKEGSTEKIGGEEGRSTHEISRKSDAKGGLEFNTLISLNSIFPSISVLDSQFKFLSTS